MKSFSARTALRAPKITAHLSATFGCALALLGVVACDVADDERPDSARADATASSPDGGATPPPTAVAPSPPSPAVPSTTELPSPVPPVAADGGAGGVGSPVAVPPGPAVPGVFVPTVCTFALPPEFTARCGHVSVPEDRSNMASGRQVRLAVAIISAKGQAAKHPDPRVYLDGGPGGQAIAAVTAGVEVFGAAFVETGRDLVVFDQRGTGLSTPRLDCPELTDTNLDSRLVDESDRVRERATKEAHARCRDRLASQATLERFGTDAAADDVEDIRLALGYSSWNLLGSSYGTRLALEVMRAHPQGLRSVILDGVVPADLNWVTHIPLAFDRMLRELGAACDRHAACGAAFPRLATRAIALAEKLERKPMPITLSNGATAYMRGQYLLQMLHALAYRVDDLAVVPELIGGVERGDSTLVGIIVEALSAGGGGIDLGLHNIVVCSETINLPTPAVAMSAIDRLNPLVAATFSARDNESACSAWNLTPAPAALRTPVSSAVPTLLLSGHFDPITPPSYAEQAASTLRRFSRFVVPDSAHGSFHSTCGAALVSSFLGDPSATPSSPCLGNAPEIDFIVIPRPDDKAGEDSVQFLDLALQERVEEAARRLAKERGQYLRSVWN
jgi:pimeloyl-ACP methyl ester carboxylesterase